MNKICIALTICLLLFLPKFGSASSVSLYGFTPASVDSLPSLMFGMKPIQKSESYLVRLIAEVDKKGKLKSIKAEEESDTRYLKFLEPYIQKLTFKPAIFDFKAKKSLLPIEVQISKVYTSPKFSFPLIADTLILDKELFERAVLLNKREFPEIISFPSYYADINSYDSTNRYPVVIEKITFKEGKLFEIQNEQSTYDAFRDQIESAILYANFKLPALKNNKFSGDIFLMISFFPQINYPTKPYSNLSDYNANLLESHSVRIIDKSYYYLSEPLPKRIPSDKLSRVSSQFVIYEPIEILVYIDTLGNANLVRPPSNSKVVNSTIKRMVSRLKFFPAINQDLQPVEFRGFIRLEPFDELNIRISYNWLK